MYVIPSGTMRLIMMFFAVILSLALLLPPLAFSQVQITVGEEATIANTNGEDVLLRAEPSYEATVLAALKEGARVEVLDGPITAGDGSFWYAVEIDDTTGYVVDIRLEQPAVSSNEVAEIANPPVEDPESVDEEAEAIDISTEAIENVDAHVEGLETVQTSEADDGNAAMAPLAIGGTGSAVTTAPLNLRAGPNLSQRVLIVIPARTTVSVTGNAQGGFLPVQYNGISGWASSNYLAQDSQPSPDSGATGSAQTTARVNFRTGPDTGSSIITVIPSGATVSLTGQSSNGFISVTYNGYSGWVHGDYLRSEGSGPAPAPQPEPEPGPDAATARVTTGLHLRSGPSTADRSILVMPAGATVTLTGNSSNGFSSVSYNGNAGWAYSSYLDASGNSGAPSQPAPPPPTTSESAVTTARLNLRSDASLSAPVTLVIPYGASVTITGAAQNGFYPVAYSGQSGWASGDYLNRGGSPAPTPSPGTGGSGITWPVRGGTWNIIQGYNGGTHQNRSATAQYYYALDIARVDGNTAGQPVYAPASGTILWVDPGSGGIAIDMGNGYTIAMFHCTFSGSLGRGQSVQQGEYLGTISGPGGAGYASTPHIDMTLWQIGSGGGRTAAPFTGGNAISGMSFADVGGWNQHGDTRFTP